ncbi:MAG: hypothetical protein HPY90_14310 [Syntrophothermus sp.]|nr:hypothetical protein [Syntrophothermus sp.]
MDEQLIALQLCLKEVGGFSMASFRERLKYQKMVYLMQLFGIDLGYRFEWYLRGPYCTELTVDGFEIDKHRDEIEEYVKDYELSNEAREKLARFRDMISQPPADGLSQESWLELLASVHYLAQIAYVKNPEDKEYGRVSARLRGMKPWYEEEQIAQAWSLLKTYGLLKG